MSAIHGFLNSRRSYPVKVLLVLAVLVLCARLASLLPLIPLAALWTLLTIVSVVAPVYLYVVFRKTPRHQQFRSGSGLSKLNNGRAIVMIVFFVVSAACSLSLLFGLPSWSLRKWGMALFAIVAFPAAYLLVAKVVKREVTPFFQNGYTVLLSCVAVTVVLVVVDTVMVFSEPVPFYQGPVQAVLSVNQPLESSPSVLVSDIAWFSAVAQGMMAYVISNLGSVSHFGYCVIELVLDAAAWYSIACLFGVCWLRSEDIKVTFSPIRANANAVGSGRLLKRYCFLAVALPVLLVAGSVMLDVHSTEIERSGEVTQAKELIRNAAGFSVDVIDGVSYDHALLVQKYASFSTEADEELVPLVNDAFQVRIGNVDGFLDWYYGTGVMNTLQRMGQKASSALIGVLKKDDRFKQDVVKHLGEDINAGANDRELASKMQKRVNRASALLAYDKDSLADCAIGREVPEWLRKEAEESDSSAALEDAERPVKDIIEAGRMLGILPGSDAGERDVVSESTTEYLTHADIGKSLVNNPAKEILPLGRGGCERDLKKALTDRQDKLIAKLTLGNTGGKSHLLAS